MNLLANLENHGDSNIWYADFRGKIWMTPLGFYRFSACDMVIPSRACIVFYAMFVGDLELACAFGCSIDGDGVSMLSPVLMLWL